MSFRPMNGQVLLRLVEAEEKTAGGLYIPESAREESSAEGIIEALPRGTFTELAVGDRVAFKSMAGEEVSLGEGKHRLVPMGDLLGKYVEADAI